MKLNYYFDGVTWNELTDTEKILKWINNE